MTEPAMAAEIAGDGSEAGSMSSSCKNCGVPMSYDSASI